MTEKIYTTQRLENKGNRKAENPVHFVRPEEGVTTVYLQDGFPHVEEAYKSLGVKVRPLSDLPAAAPAAEAKKEK